MLLDKDSNGRSITLESIDSGGCQRRLVISAYRVAGTHINDLNLAILDRNNKMLGNIVLGADDIRLLVNEILKLL